MLDFVWASSSVTASWDSTYARSTHSADVYNASGDPGYRDAISVRYYWIFESKVEGPWNQTKEDDAHGDVHAGTYWWTSENYSFNMNGKREGRYTITAKVDLTVKADLDGDGNPETQEGRNTKPSPDLRSNSSSPSENALSHKTQREGLAHSSEGVLATPASLPPLKHTRCMRRKHNEP